MCLETDEVFSVLPVATFNCVVATLPPSLTAEHVRGAVRRGAARRGTARPMLRETGKIGQRTAAAPTIREKSMSEKTLLAAKTVEVHTGKR